MNSSLGNPTFVVYAITCLVLCLNLIVVWTYSGAVRGKTKIAINPEDAALSKSPVPVHELDPPEVARVLRAHANAGASIIPFLFVGLVFVMAGGSAGFAKIDFGVFVLARLAHSFAYINGKQPWRSIFFGLGGVALLALMGDVAWLLVQGPSAN